MRYVAMVKKVLQTGIHRIGAVEGGKVKVFKPLPLANRVEIELDNSEAEPCMMFRYTDGGEFCGDTWHETFEDALYQAEYEYGLKRNDFVLVKRS